MARLGKQLTTTVALFLGSVFVVLTGVRIVHERQRLEARYALESQLITEYVARASVFPIQNFYFAGLEELCKGVDRGIVPIASCTIYLSAGDRLIPPERYLPNKTWWVDEVATGRHLREYAMDIVGEREIVGKVIIVFDWSSLPATLARIAMRQILAFTLTTLVLIVILRLVLWRLLAQPIIQLAEATRHVTEGTYELIPESARRDEIGELYRAFNLMLQVVEAQQRDLTQQATIDSLTQVANRRQLERWLSEEWARSQREEQPLGLILCDIDYFKKYNDTYGHQAGDRCLHAVATVLKQALVRPGDRLARYGGEEFVVLLPNTDAAGVTMVASHIQGRIHQAAIAHTASEYQIVTLSMGGHSLIPSPAQNQEMLLAIADQRLYAAKDQGRDRYIGAESHSVELLSVEPHQLSSLTPHPFKQ